MLHLMTFWIKKLVMNERKSQAKNVNLLWYMFTPNEFNFLFILLLPCKPTFFHPLANNHISIFVSPNLSLHKLSP